MTNETNILIKGASAKYGVPENIIKAIIQTESNFKSGIKTPEYKINKETGKKYLYGYSYGLMQILDKTGRSMGIKNPDLLLDDTVNIYTGVEHLSGLLQAYKGDVIKAVASYNAGRPIYNSAGQLVNQKYVDKVINYMNDFEKKKDIVDNTDNNSRFGIREKIPGILTGFLAKKKKKVLFYIAGFIFAFIIKAVKRFFNDCLNNK